MSPPLSSGPRSSTETKARIILVAQDFFSSKGYSHAGLREIARSADVAPSLVIKYFGTKANLFEEALVAALIPIEIFQQNRERIGEAIAASILDPNARMLAPAMIALALGDPESRRIALRVVNDRIIVPMALWLGTQNATARAQAIFTMTTGFSIFHRNMEQSLAPVEHGESARLFAKSLQDLVDIP